MRERLASVGLARLATSLGALVLFGAWVLLLLVAVLRPCGDHLCMQGFAWVAPVAAVSLAGVVWLYAARRTAAPLYLVAGYLGAGLLPRSSSTRATASTRSSSPAPCSCWSPPRPSSTSATRPAAPRSPGSRCWPWVGGSR